jgi:aspartyl/glutamyl-tRNA(Asn/Gln) amidotransferase C subunit
MPTEENFCRRTVREISVNFFKWAFSQFGWHRGSINLSSLCGREIFLFFGGVMEITKELVMAKSAEIMVDLTDSEVLQLKSDIEEALKSFEVLLSFDAKNLTSSQKTIDIEELREDAPDVTLSVNDALQNAPQKSDNFFTVLKTVE